MQRMPLPEIWSTKKYEHGYHTVLKQLALTGLAFFGGASFGSGRFLKRRPSVASSSPYAARAETQHHSTSYQWMVEI